ncbi:MAG: polysaccharide biosynthesis/export family protein [Pseudomonadota bacterium]
MAAQIKEKKRYISLSDIRFVTVVLAAAFTSGCATSTAPLSSPTFAEERTGNLGRQYRLGIGDKLKITVFGEPDLSGDFEIDSIGRVAMPLIGNVPAEGQTIAEFSNTAKRKFSNGYLKNPRLSIEVLNYRPIFVHGEVRSGGQFTFKNGLRIRDAIAIAGGYSYRADQSYVLIARDSQPTVRLPLASNIPVLPGDNIRVPERFF